MEEVQRLIDQVKVDIEEGKTDEEIFRSFTLVMEKDPELRGQMAELLATIPHEKVAKLLQRMLDVSEGKKVRKTIKRSLYRLKSKGIVGKEASMARGRSILHPMQVAPPKGFGSGIDYLGQRLLVLVIPHLGRGWTVMQGVVSDSKGLVDFSGEDMPRKGFKEFFEGIQEKSALPLIEMDPPYVGFVFTQAYRLTIERKETPPQDYLHLKTEIEGIKKEYDRPLIYSYLPPDEMPKEDLLPRRTEDLLKSDLFSSWMIEEDLIRSYADAVWEAEGSKIILSDTQKEARFQEIYLKALSELFSEERRFLYKRRLEEMAYVLFKLGRQEEVRVCLSQAVNLEKPINPIQPNPFLHQLVTRSIFTLLAEAYEKRKKESSLIVKP